MKFNESKALKYLKKNLSAKRFNHVLGTKKCAIMMAKHYGVDEKKAKIAALLHDCGKWLDDDKIIKWTKLFGYNIDDSVLSNPQLYHGVAGAYIAKKKFNISDSEILEAICYHTIPKPNMSDLAKIIYVADKIEETRTFDDVKKIRSSLDKGLDFIFLMTLKQIKLWHIRNNKPLHTRSVDTYNHMLKAKSNNK